MRLNSRSILSPARNNGGPTTLTTSASRRLRRNVSLRGGAQSPALFPSAPTKKARGSSAFAENPEPSSPKVTCIGQVRVKTKKQGKKIKFRACGSPPPPTAAEEGGGKNTRWVHLPLSLCETIKGLGNDFSCLVPCKSSCFSDNNANDSVNHDYYGNDGRDYRENEVKESISSCGTMFRWFVSLQDEGESGEKRSKVMERDCSRRRSIFDDMEFDDLFKNGNDDVRSDCKGVEEGGRASVSVCVPPKNALLLMRCRSDPIKMASLSRKFLEDPFVHGVDGDEDGDAVEVKEGGVVKVKEELEVREEEVMEVKVENRGEIDDNLEVREEEMVEMKERNDDEVFQKLEVNENEVLEVKEDNHVRVNENLEVGEEEIMEVKDDDNIRVNENLLEVGEEEMMETVVERKEVEECVELDEFEEAVDERFEGLEVIEPKVEDLDILGEELGQKLDENEDEIQGKSEEMRLEEMEENQGIENIEDRKEEQIVEDTETKENTDETGERQKIEISEQDEQVLQNVEEIRLIEDDKYANVFSIESFTDKEKVEESESEQFLVKMLEDQIMEVLMREAEESYELSNNTSTSRTSFEESKELDPKEETIKVEKELVEEETRKSIEKENNKPKTLPDCLLLMMCEPKLSLEVSKETWVCSTDFLRTLPEHRVSEKPNKTEGPDDQSSCGSNKKPKPAAVAAQPPHQPGFHLAQSGIKPGRSSISFPANVIEKKVAKAGLGYEPLVLTRCKSAPMRSAAKFELACSMWGSGCSRLLR